MNGVKSMGEEKLEELERALRNELSEDKLKFIDKYRLQLNSRRRWVCKKNQTPERVYFSHKFAMDNGILEFLFRKYQFCFAKLKYFRKNLDKFSANIILKKVFIRLSYGMRNFSAINSPEK